MHSIRMRAHCLNRVRAHPYRKILRLDTYLNSNLKRAAAIRERVLGYILIRPIFDHLQVDVMTRRGNQTPNEHFAYCGVRKRAKVS